MKLQLSIFLQNTKGWLIQAGLCVFVAAFFGLVNYSFLSQTIEATDAQISTNNNILFYAAKAFNGQIIERYPDGHIYRKTHYSQGRKDGDSFEYGIENQLKNHYRYKDGQKEGLQEGWFLEGPKRFEAHYSKGLLHGLQTEWHLKGSVFRQQVYENGTEVSQKILFSGGEVYSNYFKVGNRTFGLDGGPLCFEPKKDGEKL